MQDKRYHLYRHTTPSGKVYIGITCQKPENRWNNGRGYFNAVKTPLKSSIMKYGWENIKHEVLFSNLTKERAKNLEIKLIRHYRLLGISLNVTEGGEGTTGIIPWNYKKKLSYEQSNKLRGKHFSDSHKEKLSKAHSKPIRIEGNNLVMNFTSILDAAKFLNCSDSTVSRYAGNHRIYKGFKIEYK